MLGHSLGGIVAMLYGARHPDHAGGLVLSSTMARFDLDQLVGAFRAAAGDEVAELARRSYAGDPVSATEWAKVFAAFGPRVPDAEELARRLGNPDVAGPGMELLRRLDIVDQLSRITCRTLVCVGTRDPVTPEATAREIIDALPPGLGQLEVIDDAGHFLWLDHPDRYWPLISTFLG